MRGSGAGWRLGAAGHGGLDGLLLLGRELELRLARVHLLHVYARLVAVVDRRYDHPRAARVEQRERGRLATRHLAVGVVADQRRVGDATVDPLLCGAHPAL